jgi:hypothetical protein
MGDETAAKSLGITQEDLLGSTKAVGRRMKRRKPMARQESEDRMVAKAPGNRSQTRDTHLTGGGKAVPVKEEGRQQRLNFVTAENPQPDLRSRKPGGNAFMDCR